MHHISMSDQNRELFECTAEYKAKMQLSSKKTQFTSCIRLNYQGLFQLSVSFSSGVGKYHRKFLEVPTLHVETASRDITILLYLFLLL